MHFTFASWTRVNHFDKLMGGERQRDRETERERDRVRVRKSEEAKMNQLNEVEPWVWSHFHQQFTFLQTLNPLRVMQLIGLLMRKKEGENESVKADQLFLKKKRCKNWIKIAESTEFSKVVLSNQVLTSNSNRKERSAKEQNWRQSRSEIEL